MARTRSSSTRWNRSGWPRPSRRCATKSNHLLARKGARPKVFLANLGTPADFTARATFAKSFFETGGIEALDSGGFSRSGRTRRGLEGLRCRAGMYLLV